MVADRYFVDRLKENLRQRRGSGSRIRFEDDSIVPSDFKDNFLMNSANKHELGLYFAEKLIEFNSSSDENIEVLVCTHGDTVITNCRAIELEKDITNCQSEEADQRIVRHVINCSKHYLRVDALTIDTDVLCLIIHVYPTLKANNSSIAVLCGTGLGTASMEYYNIREIGESLGEVVCKGLPFFNAFTGCDTVSSFFGYSKGAFWNAWMTSVNKDKLTEVFTVLSDQPKEPTPGQIDTLEAFLLEVYYPGVKTCGLNRERQKHFMRLADPNFRSIPVSRKGLVEHTKRACLQAGWLWREALSNVDRQDPTKWGWNKDDSKFVPKWQTVTGDDSDIYKVIQVCTNCKKALCKKCKCKKDNLKCLPYCGCQQRCSNI